MPTSGISPLLRPSEGDQVKWLLRELRPVSFQLKRGAEAKCAQQSGASQLEGYDYQHHG